MKEKDLFWLSFCSLFGAWKIVGMAFLCLDLVPLSETVFPFVQSAVTARVNLNDPQISTRKDQIFFPLHRHKSVSFVKNSVCLYQAYCSVHATTPSFGALGLTYPWFDKNTH